jgi:predicted transposase YbfD/YdcC
MEENNSLSIVEHFGSLPDPRVERRKRHDLLDIIVIAICTVICGGDSWVSMELFGKAKEKWFKAFLELPNGIPSHDTFRRVFMLLNPEKFAECFLSWVSAVSREITGGIVAFDGKTLRRSFDKAAQQSALHLVSAWSSSNNLSLGQIQVAEKSNEITAIPKLLDILDVSGCIVTIDAMGCQKDIAAKIRDNNADYVLALKGNQGSLHEDVELFFQTEKANNFNEFKTDFHETTDGEHGRIEVRRYYTTDEISWLGADAEWKDIRSIGMVERERTINGKTTVENAYYISSLASNAQVFGNAVRAHWGIENSLHWILDIAFREDESRIRKDNGPQNFAMLRKIALNLLKADKSTKVGIKEKRLKAGWDHDYLTRVLFQDSNKI